jgi:hypothetical protein
MPLCPYAQRVWITRNNKVILHSFMVILHSFISSFVYWFSVINNFQFMPGLHCSLSYFKNNIYVNSLFFIFEHPNALHNLSTSSMTCSGSSHTKLRKGNGLSPCGWICRLLLNQLLTTVMMYLS